jgi:hypothetical protein
MTDDARDYSSISHEEAVSRRLMHFLQEGNIRALRAANAPADEQREEFVAIVGRLAQMFQDICADPQPLAAFLVRQAYDLMPRSSKAIPAEVALRGHIGWAVKVLSENEETGGRGVPEAAKAVAEDLQAVGFLPRYGRLAGKPLSSEIIEQWFYRTDGGYDEQEEANRAYRMQQERMAAKYPDYAAWPRPRRRAWVRRYISRLAWSAVFSQTALGKEITSDVI